MSIRIVFWRFFFATFWFAGLSSCARDPQPLEERLQAALDERLQRCEVKGASVAVMFPDETLWKGVSGVSHEAVKMSPDMSFAIGSITKNMVAALTLQLAEEGKLSLEDSVDEWLPPFRYVDSSITIRQLLDHSSGLFMFWDNQAIWDDLIQCREKTFTPEEVLEYIKEPYFAPGDGYRYSNTNYLLAAMIITKVTESKLSVELRRRFWEPLGLRSACLPLEEPYPENLAHVWGQNFEKNGAYRDVTFLPRTSHDSITFGSGGVFMTAEDLARWTHALFHNRVINKASLAQMQQFTAEGSHGLGLDRLGRAISGRLRSVGHGGGNIGTTAYMAYLPDYDVSVAVMINHFGGDCAGRIVRDVSRIAALSVRPEPIADIVFSLEGLFSGFWLISGLGVVIFGVRRKKPSVMIIFGCFAITGGWLSTRGEIPVNEVLIPLGAAVAVLGFAFSGRSYWQSKRNNRAQPPR